MIHMVIAELADDDEEVFMLSLYKDYYGLVRKTLYSITQDRGILEDLINDTFIKLMEKISLIRTLASCKTVAYVVYTSRSVGINYLKRKSTQNKHVYFGKDTDFAEKVAGIEDTIENKIIHREEIEELGSAILRLPEKQKDLLYFKYMLEMDDVCIAEISDIAPNSVRQYLTRARRKKKNYGQGGFE